jgi:hypothetical protein
MLATARFEIIEEVRPHDYPWVMDIVAKPVNKDPVLPPRSYYRERGEARECGEPELPFGGYYDLLRQRDEAS